MFNFKILAKIPKLSLRKRFLVLILILVAGIGINFILPHFVQAQGIVSAIVTPIVSAIASYFIIGFLGVPFLISLVVLVVAIMGVFISGWFFQQILAMNQTFGFTRDAFVVAGWTLVRDLVGMIFIVVLVLVAFSTILRLKQYELGKILPKLIFAAIMLNFSLVIAGVILDVSTIVMNVFLSKFIGLGNIAKYLVGDMFKTVFDQFVDFIKSLPGKGIGGVGELLPFVLQMMLYIMSLAVFYSVTTIVFLMLFIVFFVRMIALMILLILSPLAFVAWVLPQTAGLWKKWWQEFFQWSIIGIPVAFFLYLSFLLMTTGTAFDVDTSVGAKEMADALGWQGGFGITAGLAAILKIFMKFGAVLLLMIIGVMLGFTSSGKGAGMAVQWAKKAPEWIANRKFVQERIGRGAKEAVEAKKSPEAMERLRARKFLGVPIGKALAPAVKRMPGIAMERMIKYAKAPETEAQKIQGQIAGLSPDAQKSRRATASPLEKVFATLQMINDRNLGKILDKDPEFRKEVDGDIQMALKQGRPDLAKNILRSVPQVATKELATKIDPKEGEKLADDRAAKQWAFHLNNPGDIVNIDPRAIDDKDIQDALVESTLTHFRELWNRLGNKAFAVTKQAIDQWEPEPLYEKAVKENKPQILAMIHGLATSPIGLQLQWLGLDKMPKNKQEGVNFDKWVQDMKKKHGTYQLPTAGMSSSTVNQAGLDQMLAGTEAALKKLEKEIKKGTRKTSRDIERMQEGLTGLSNQIKSGQEEITKLKDAGKETRNFQQKIASLEEGRKNLEAILELKKKA